MTFAELEAEAKAMGYRLIPNKSAKEKLLPCICGYTRRDHCTRWDNKKHDFEYALICQKCGKKAVGSSEKNVIHNWNEMIKAERGE